MAISYRIKSIKTSQFAMFPEKYVNGESVDMHFQINFNVPKTLDSLKCSLKIDYVQNDNLLMTIVTECGFGINEEGIKEIREKKKIDVDFLRYIASITVGAVRGIIAAKTENTVINGIVLPPVNLTEFLKDDFKLITPDDSINKNK